MGTPVPIHELVELTRARLIGDGSRLVDGLAALLTATQSHLCFVRSQRFVAEWIASEGGAALVAPGLDAEAVYEGDSRKRPLLVVDNIELALVAVLTRFAPVLIEVRRPGVHPSAVIHPSALIAETAHIGPCCTIGAGAAVGEGSVLVAQVHLGENAVVGAATRLEPGVRVLDRCRIGSHCIVHAGVVVGADGFGYVPGPRGLVKVPHIGDVVVQDHVEIGANSCIDRAKFGSTVVGMGTKIDNLVQIGHGCVIGRFCILCGQSGLAGSVTMGDGVVVGGRAAIADNLTIGDGARIGGGSGVGVDVPAGASFMGSPAMEAHEFRRSYIAFKGMGKLMPRLRRLIKAADAPG